MNYWLLKTEPETYSWFDLLREKKTEWTGVRSYEARNNMKKMSVDDLVFIYHSGKEKQLMGIATIIAVAHPDPTDTTDLWCAVTVAPVREMNKKISLNDVKKISACSQMILLKKSRLSVQPVTEKEWNALVNF